MDLSVKNQLMQTNPDDYFEKIDFADRQYYAINYDIHLTYLGRELSLEIGFGGECVGLAVLDLR